MGGASTRSTWRPAKEGYVESYPTPDELWAKVFAKPNAWRDRFAAIPFEERGGTWQTRYYQHNAIENALEAIAAGKQRILLTLATGTGKTAIAFQIAWALFQSRWNLSREPTRRPRILFLADRNILADQAYNAFSAFPEDALARIKPDEIRKTRPRAEERQRLLHNLPDFHERNGRRTASPHRISATIRLTSSTSSSSTSAIAAAPTTKATGAAFSTISRPPFSLA